MSYALKRTKRMLAFVLALVLSISMFTMPVSADELDTDMGYIAEEVQIDEEIVNELETKLMDEGGFDPALYPEGPVLGPPIIIPSKVPGGNRSIAITLTGDIFKLDTDGTIHGDASLATSWVVHQSDPDASALTSLPAGPFSDLMLQKIEIVNSSLAYLHFSGEGDPGTYFYIRPMAAALQSGKNAAPLIVYIGEPDEVTNGELSFEVYVPGTDGTTHGAGSIGPMPHIPFGINERDFLHVVVTRNGGDFTEDALDASNWIIRDTPIIGDTTAGGSGSDNDVKTANSGNVPSLTNPYRIPSIGLSLIGIEAIADSDNQLLFIFEGNDILGGPFPELRHKTLCTNALGVVNHSTGCSDDCYTAEQAAHRLFMRALEDALDGAASKHYEDVSPEQNNPGIPIDIPSLPLSLEIVNRSLGWQSAGPADMNLSPIEIAAGQHPGDAIRNIVVRATLENQAATFTAAAKNLDNWRVAIKDDELENFLTAFGRGVKQVRGLVLTNVQVLPGGHAVDLTLETTKDSSAAAGFGSKVLTTGIDGWGANPPSPLAGDPVNRVFIEKDTGSGEPQSPGSTSTLTSPDYGAPFHIYIRALEGAITVPSTVGPHYTPTKFYTHEAVTGDPSHQIGASYLVVVANEGSGGGEATGMTATGSNPDPNGDYLAANVMDPAKSGYKPFSFYESYFRGNQKPEPKSQSWRVLYVTLLGGETFKAASTVNNLNNWALSTPTTNNHDPSKVTFGDPNRLYLPNTANTGDFNFGITSVERISNTHARVILTEVSGKTPTALTDVDNRPFYINVSGNATNSTNSAYARVELAPFIPPIEITDVSESTESDPVYMIPTTPGFAGVRTVNVKMSDSDFMDVFTQDINFRSDALPNHIDHILNWEYAVSAPGSTFDPNLATWYQARVGWPTAGTNPNIANANTGSLSPTLASTLGLSLYSATLKPDGTVELSFNDVGIDNARSGSQIHIRAVSTETAGMISGSRALKIGHRYTDYVTIQRGLAPDNDQYMTVVSAKGVGGSTGTADDSIPVANWNNPYDKEKFNSPNKKPGLSPSVVLRDGAPRNTNLNFRFVTVEITGATVNPATNLVGGAALGQNPSHWTLREHTNISGADPDISTTRDSDVYGLKIVHAENLGPGENPNTTKYLLTIAGDAELHANAILAVDIDSNALLPASTPTLTALVRIGDDLRPRLKTEIFDQSGNTVTHLPALASSNDTATVRVWVENDWFTREAANKTNWATNWNGFINITSAQEAAHHVPAPGASGRDFASFNFASLQGVTAIAGNQTLAASRIVKMEVGNQQYIGNKPVEAFEYVDITIKGPLTSGTYVALSPAYSGTPSNNIIPAMVGGQAKFDVSATTIHLPVEYAIFPVGIAAVISHVPVTDITGVPKTAIAGTELQLSGTVVPSNATKQTIAWTVVNPGTTGATISGTSRLNATAAGTVTVKATIVDGKDTGLAYTQNFDITVTPAYVSVTEITGIPTNATAGTPLTLGGTVAPVNATKQKIEWSIVNAGTTGATLLGDVLSATAAGTVTVRATIVNGLTSILNYEKDFTITVGGPAFVPVTAITGVPTSATAGTNLTLTGIVEPSNATNKTIEWSVVNAGTTGATVNGNTLSATAEGIAKIRATVVNGISATNNFVYEFDVTVTEVVTVGELTDLFQNALNGLSLNAEQQTALDNAMASLSADLNSDKKVADVLFGLFFELNGNDGKPQDNPLASAVEQMNTQDFARLLFKMLLGTPDGQDLDAGVTWLAGLIDLPASNPDKLSRQAAFNMLTDLSGAFDARFAAAGFTNSYDATMRAIRDIYWNTLGWYHIGDGFDYWVGESVKGKTREEIIADFFYIIIGSEYDSMNDFEFTVALFNAYWPSGIGGNYDEFNRWLNRLEAREFTRWGMVEAYIAYNK